MEGKQSLDLNAPFIYHLQPSQKGLQGVLSTSANSKLTPDLAQKCRSRQEDVLPPPPHPHTRVWLAGIRGEGKEGTSFFKRRGAQRPPRRLSGGPIAQYKAQVPRKPPFPRRPQEKEKCWRKGAHCKGEGSPRRYSQRQARASSQKTSLCGKDRGLKVTCAADVKGGVMLGGGEASGGSIGMELSHPPPRYAY